MPRLDDRLRQELQSLLKAVIDDQDAKATNLTLNVTLSGINPFLGFYLRGFDQQKMVSFQARFKEVRYGTAVNIDVYDRMISVQSSDYLALIDATREHLLAAPVLSSGD